MNSINQKDCLVEIEFSIGSTEFLVRRGIAPAVFEIERNGKPLDQESKAKDFQKYLEKNILQLNYKSFTQIVILGSSSFVPFMKLTAADRRVIIEDLLDITIFSSMNTVLKEKSSALKNRLYENEVEGKQLAKTIKMQQEYIGKLKGKVGDIVKTKEGLIEAAEEEIKESHEKIEKLQGRINGLLQGEIAAYEKHYKKSEQLKEYNYKLSQRLKNVEKELKFFNSNDSCPTCKQDIEEGYKSEMVSDREEKKVKLDEGLEKLKKEIEEIDHVLHHIHLQKGMVNTLENEINTVKTNIKSQEDYIKRLQAEIQSLNDDQSGEIEEEEAKVKAKRQELQALAQERKALLDDAKVYEIATEMLKDSGIKTKIVRQYLPVINKLINKYLAEMNFYVNFTLDESFKESIESRFRDNFSYASFSEGQRMRIDLALLFTWVEIARMKNSANTNLLFLDEVFDSSLDEDGTEDFMKVLKNSISGKNVYVISHKSDQLIDKFHDTIEFELHNNFSKRVS